MSGFRTKNVVGFLKRDILEVLNVRGRDIFSGIVIFLRSVGTTLGVCGVSPTKVQFPSFALLSLRSTMGQVQKGYNSVA